MRRLLHTLALLLGLTLLAADPASAARLQGQKVASGSVAFAQILASANLLLSTERAGEKSASAYDIASGSPVAARGAGSALREASGAAFRAADDVAAFRVPAKHLPGAGGRYAKFGDGVDPHGAIAEALRSPNAVFSPNNVDGSFRVMTDLGRAVGSRGETAIRVVVGNDGKIWTAFPVKP